MLLMWACRVWSYFRYLFRSGNPEHPGDRFYNTTVEVLLSESSGVLVQSKPVTMYPRSEDGFLIINKFDADSGLVEGDIPEAFGLVDTIRLFVQSSSQSWVILSEVRIVLNLGDVGISFKAIILQGLISLSMERGPVVVDFLSGCFGKSGFVFVFSVFRDWLISSWHSFAYTYEYSTHKHNYGTWF